jgi:hypothetical protein
MSSDLVVQDQKYADGKYLQSLAQQTIPASVLLDYWHKGYSWNGDTQLEDFSAKTTTPCQNSFIIWVLRFAFAFYAAYLAFKCNFVPTTTDPYRSFFLALLYAIIAAMLGPIYLMYYLFVHVIGDSYLEEYNLPSSCPSKNNLNQSKM